MNFITVKVVGPSAAINYTGSKKGAGFHFHAENHGKQLQIVNSQNNQIS